MGDQPDSAYFLSVPAYGCTAVAISPRVVLTAAHCLPTQFTGCPGKSFSPESMTFAGVDGLTATNDALQVTIVGSKAIPHPDAFFPMGACPEAACTQTALSCTNLEKAGCAPQKYGTLNWSSELIAIHLDQQLPSYIPLFRVLVDPQYDGQFPLRTASFAKVLDWAATKPRTLNVGYDGDDARFFGLSTWDSIERDGISLGWTDCSTLRSGTSDGRGVAKLVNATPGLTEPGDSGGPVFFGAGPAWGQVLPTPLPAPGSPLSSPGDTYQPGEVVLAAITSGGSLDVTSSVPTFLPHISKWIVETVLRDTDGDESPDWADNCVFVSNPDQLDTDDDKLGNACDGDDDNDGIPDAKDACPLISGKFCILDGDSDDDGFIDSKDNCPTKLNPDQKDFDKDGLGDACDLDDDNDGLPDVLDNCPGTPSPSALDSDGDGLGNACDPDRDGDGFLNSKDNCPDLANPDQLDTDKDGLGNACDPDDDNDGLSDLSDSCPLSPTQCGGGTEPVDQDGDGVSDGADNCPVHANPEQQDFDKDGLGNACDLDDDNDGFPDTVDNCPITSSFDQLDSDGDGIGNPCELDDDDDGTLDVFDNCPLIANADQADMDADGLGDACDLCPVLAAISDSDTPGAGLDSDQDGLGDRCDVCPFVKNTLAPCSTNVDCAFGPSPELGKRCLPEQGRCTNPLDSDGDGTPDECDGCSALADSEVAYNSNERAEERERKSNASLPSLNDACDPVPLVVSRAIEAPKSAGGYVPHFEVDAGKTTIFVSSAQVGQPTTTQGGPLGLNGLRYAGFRHCGCINEQTGEERFANDCWTNQCNNNPASFSFTDNSAANTWRKVTIGTISLSSGNTKLQPLLQRQIFTPFASDIDCATDTWAHPNDDASCRIGNLFGLRWEHDVDARRTSGLRPVQSYDAKSKTLGFFWSHVVEAPNEGSWFSPRDMSTQGKLRDHYEFVKTPRTSPVAIDPGDFAVGPCKFNCLPTFRHDWHVLLPRTVPFGGDPWRMGHHALLLPLQDGRIAAVHRADLPATDVTDRLPQSLREAMTSGGYQWLTPVERGLVGRGQAKTWQFAAIARSWQGADSPAPLALRSGEQAMEVVSPDCGPRCRTATSTLAATTGEPGPREGAFALFSAMQESIYLLGGEANGAPTEELWRYDLNSNRWSQIFTEGSLKPATILAATLDSERGRLLVLEERPVGKKKVARLLLWNTATGQSKVLFTVPRKNVFQRFGLTVDTDGSLVLMAGKKNGWVAFSLRVDATDTLQWQGFDVGQGELLDSPFSSTEGVFVPVERKDKAGLERLEIKSFKNPGQGCEEL